HPAYAGTLRGSRRDSESSAHPETRQGSWGCQEAPPFQLDEPFAGHSEHMLQTGQLTIERSGPGMATVDGRARHAECLITLNSGRCYLGEALAVKYLAQLLNAGCIPVPGLLIAARILQIPA